MIMIPNLRKTTLEVTNQSILGNYFTTDGCFLLISLR